MKLNKQDAAALERLLRLSLWYYGTMNESLYTTVDKETRGQITRGQNLLREIIRTHSIIEKVNTVSPRLKAPRDDKNAILVEVPINKKKVAKKRV